MCGRFGLSDPADVPERFDVEPLSDLPADSVVTTPRFNIAPSQDVLVVAQSKEGNSVLRPMRWGLVPFWTKDLKTAPKSINLRAETVFERANFRTLLERRRCIIPADGFYEWQKLGARKQPWNFTLTSGEIFGFAGLWDYWKQGEQAIVSCTILTTSPNELVGRLHDRMPVILSRQNERTWLDRSVDQIAALLECTQPYPDSLMAGHPVVSLVNNVKNEGAALRRPAEEEGAAVLPVQQSLL